MTVAIFAPHVDDEVIGCWSLLQQKDVLVVYCSRLDPVREKEATLAALRFGFDVELISKNILEDYKVTQIWGPDPHWELHPLHKTVGAMAIKTSRRHGIPFGSYSTSMNVPYLRELPPAERDMKRSCMNEIYKSQRPLWQHDHRYFLFEGLALWNPTVG